MPCFTAPAAEKERNVVHMQCFPRNESGYFPGGPAGIIVESFMRAHKIPHVVHFGVDPEVSPTGRLPCIELNGETTAESHFIIERLAREFNLPEEKLSRAQRAKGIALRRIFEQSANFHHIRAFIVDNVETGARLFGPFLPVPKFMHGFAMGQARKNQIANLNTQGEGDLTDVQYHAEFLSDIEAAEAMLEESDFAVSSEFTHVDSTVFGYLSIIRSIARQLPADRLALVPAYQLVLRSAVINAYVDRVEAVTYPDAAKILAMTKADPKGKEPQSFPKQAFTKAN